MIAKITAPILMKAFKATESHRGYIQGFYDEERGLHYVRDLTLDRGQQTRWTQHGAFGAYEKNHALMMEEIERLQMIEVCLWLYENSPVTTKDL